jgi:Flp pilus assembly protein TadD
MVAALQLDLGKATDNLEMQSAALEAAIASGHALKSALPDIYDMQGQIALKRGDKAAAEAAFSKVAEARPTNPRALVKLAEAKYQLGKLTESHSLVTRAISLQRAARQEVPASWSEAAQKLSAELAASPR